jgi:hypothetical protein
MNEPASNTEQEPEIGADVSLDDFEIEVVDDLPEAPKEIPTPPPNVKADPVRREDISEEIPDEELGEYNERVKRRMAKLTYQARKAQTDLEEARKIKEEATEYAKSVLQENNRIKEMLSNGENVLLSKAKESAELALNAAKDKYRKAYETGDTDALVEAQADIAKSQLDLTEATRSIARPRPKPQPQQVPQNIARPQLPKPSPRQQKWFEDNPWFQDDNHRDMTAIAFAKHENLIRSGVQVNSDEYYQQIDGEVRRRFPEYFGTSNSSAQEPEQQVEVEVPAAAQPARPKPVVAPAQRSNSSAPRKFRLKASQVKAAKELGLTPERYAAQLIKEGYTHD